MIAETQTIAAISTAMNNSGIGIIRISGPEAFCVIRKIFRPAAGSGKDICEKSHTVHYGHIMDGETIVDEVLVLIMKAPHTYTREDTVEIDCHGGMFVMNRVLELVLAAGARTAEPGEFTKRAFLNGRIDLSQAEAVIDVINAENDYALRSAVTQLRGSVSQKIRSIRAILLENIAYIEAALDDPEHIEMDGFGQELLPLVEKCRDEIKALIDTAQDGRIMKEGIRTVILGKPNVGKSSLMNALLGMQRAIVTQIPGTTRDAIEESVRIGDITLNMVDTAGIRETQDVVEKIGVDKAREYAAQADLLVWVVDSSAPLDADDEEIAKIIRDRKAVVLLNKSDLPEVTRREDVYRAVRKVEDSSFVTQNASAWEKGIAHQHPGNVDFSSDEINDAMDHLQEEPDAVGDKGKVRDHYEEVDFATKEPWLPVVSISTITEEGLKDFTDSVRQMFYNKEINFNDQIYITNARHKEALCNAYDSLGKAMDSIAADMPEDFYTIDMMDAYSSLGVVIGEALEDDLADEIFGKFCMGK